MGTTGNLLQYVLGPVQLVGLVVVVLGALAPKLIGSRAAQNNQRTLVIGLVAIGALTVIGGIGLEAARGRIADIEVNDNLVYGDGNALGVGNRIAAPEAPKPSPASRKIQVNDNRAVGDHNAVGVGNSLGREEDAPR